MSESSILSFGSFLISQYFSQDFPHGGFGQLITKFYYFRHFVDGQYFSAKINDVFGRGCFSRLNDFYSIIKNLLLWARSETIGSA